MESSRFPQMEEIPNMKCFVRNFYIGKLRRRYFSTKNLTFLEKILSCGWKLLCQALPSFYSKYKEKSLFISVSNELYEKYLVTQDNCVSTHVSFCFLEGCKIHLIFIRRSLNQIFRRLYQYIYQEIDCLYNLCKHKFYTSLVASSGEVFNQLSGAVNIT